MDTGNLIREIRMVQANPASGWQVFRLVERSAPLSAPDDLRKVRAWVGACKAFTQAAKDSGLGLHADLPGARRSVDRTTEELLAVVGGWKSVRDRYLR